MNNILILCLILTIIIIYNCFNYNLDEGFVSNGPLPSVITADNFNQYFQFDPNISNCSNKSGCPSNPKDFITDPGKIVWKNGKSATFRTKDNNPVLPSGTGFVGFKLDSVPMGEKIWNSIWLMGKNAGRSECGPCLEIDIYESNNTWWGNNGTNITVPKISFHDWPKGKGGGPKSNQGCFGAMLSGSTGGWNTATNSHSYCGGKIVKNWPNGWDSAKSQIYKGATWFTLLTKDSSNKPLVYVGISLKGWLPKSHSEATYQNVLSNSDFLVSSGAGNINGNPTGGFFFCLTSTTSGSTASGEWNIPKIVHFDGASGDSKPPSGTHSGGVSPSGTHSGGVSPSGTHSGPSPDDSSSTSKSTGKNKLCTTNPATIESGCECPDPNNLTNKLPCSLQPNGQCKISGNDGWGTCDPACCEKNNSSGAQQLPSPNNSSSKLIYYDNY